MSRDFIGYGKEKPKIFWPQGNKIAVSFVVNIEEGAELSVSSGDSQNEHVFENNKTKILDIPDLCMESHFEYGLRSGIWRIFDALDKYNIKTVAIGASYDNLRNNIDDIISEAQKYDV